MYWISITLKIVLPLFVNKKYQSTATMLTGDSLKINFNLSTENSSIDSESFNQSKVNYPIHLEIQID